MHCSQVTEHLSDFVDNLLDPATRAEVEAHLSHCQSCSAELASLRSYLKTMSSLPRIQAPQDFLASINDRLAQPGWCQRLLRWLFFPMRAKLPFEVAGLVAASLLVVLLYRGGEPEKAQVAPAHPEPVLSVSPRPAVEEARQEAAQLPARDTFSIGKGARSPAAPSQPIQLVLQLEPMADQQPAPGASSATTASQAGGPTLPGKTMPGRMHAGEKGPQAAPERVTTALSRIKELVARARGSMLSVDPEQPILSPHVVTVEIPSRSYDSLVEQLDRLGRLEKPPAKPGIPPEEALILLQIRLLPPR